MSYFKYHVFFCCNQREGGLNACENGGASEAQAYAKDRIDALGLKGRGRVRISKAGCMGRCGEGPVLVVYPEGVWYRYEGIADVEAIIQSHMVGGEILERLRIGSE